MDSAAKTIDKITDLNEAIKRETFGLTEKWEKMSNYGNV